MGSRHRDFGLRIVACLLRLCGCLNRNDRAARNWKYRRRDREYSRKSRYRPDVDSPLSNSTPTISAITEGSYFVEFRTDEFLEENDVEHDNPAEQKDEEENRDFLPPRHLHIFPLHSPNVTKYERRNRPRNKPDDKHPCFS